MKRAPTSMQFYKKYSVNVITRIIAILIICASAVYFWFLTPYWTVSLWMLLFLVLFTLDLIQYTEKSKRDMTNFLIAIKQNDFTTTTHTSTQKYDLQYAQKEILKVFQYLNTEKEFEHQYLKTIVAHVQVALICFDTTGEIVLFNNAASELFHRKFMKNIVELRSVDQGLFHKTKSIRAGQKALIKLVSEGNLWQLSIQATTFKLRQKEFKLVSYQDIKSELEEKELESWQKLIRVMTHEIKNSAIPIATLTDVIYQQLNEGTGEYTDLKSLNQEDLEDLKISLKTISHRSKGLVNFVKAYNSLTKIPNPVVSEVNIMELISGIETLMQQQLANAGVTLSVNYENPELSIKVDGKLIEQILINLFINALEAIQGIKKPQITIDVYENKSGSKCIKVGDNGKGIDTEILEHIFVPFFTTKTDGSGIGLSISRQIMRLHKGSIEILFSGKKGTTVLLTF